MRITVSEKVFKEKNLEVGEIYANEQYIKKMYKKLADLEDIEDELGIELLIIFKALKDGIWSKIFGEIEKITPDENCHLVIDRNSNPEDDGFWILDYYDVRDSRGVSIQAWFIYDYGKTWALTREELE